jgi:glutaredoxin
LRFWLQENHVSFVEIDVKQDQQAAEYVRAVNNGERVTPTVVFGERAFLLVKPDRQTLDDALWRAGYRLGADSDLA